jgi:hypothetical protein
MDGSVYLELDRVKGLDDRIQVLAEPDRIRQENHQVNVAIFPGIIAGLGTIEEDPPKTLLENGVQPELDLFPQVVTQHDARASLSCRQDTTFGGNPQG